MKGDNFAYYLVDHTKGVIFWMDDVPGEWIGIRHGDDNIPVDPQICLELQYWHHVEMFPSHMAECGMATADRLATLKAMVIAAITDTWHL